MDRAPIIELENVTKVYDLGEQKVDALKGVSLKIFPGEIVALMIESSPEKSPLAKRFTGSRVSIQTATRSITQRGSTPAARRTPIRRTNIAGKVVLRWLGSKVISFSGGPRSGGAWDSSHRPKFLSRA